MGLSPLGRGGKGLLKPGEQLLFECLGIPSTQEGINNIVVETLPGCFLLPGYNGIEAGVNSTGGPQVSWGITYHEDMSRLIFAVGCELKMLFLTAHFLSGDLT